MSQVNTESELKLWWSTNTGITLSDALDKSGIGGKVGGVGLLSSPTAFIIATVNGSDVCTRMGSLESGALESVFEARCFDSTKELRWLRTDHAGGTAVLLSEDKEAVERLGDTKELQVIKTLPAHYLLWGIANAVTADDISGSSSWTVLKEFRIRSFEIPVVVTAEKRAQLHSIEYLGRGKYGNVSVVEERLVGFEEYSQLDKQTVQEIRCSTEEYTEGRPE